MYQDYGIANWSSMDKTTLRNWLIDLLHKEVVTIRFTKKNGDERVMKATLNERLVANTAGTGRKENAEVISVTDIVLDQWRSIRLDSIKEISFDSKNK